ncbi:hypothetical protein BN2475_750020 [Paraburkholderia ribeironis]|uniref:Uncharacterized protein n=1 Tax=Paraburkholderia ribeironis TaxID=1247936 RepID=A0A1N7SKM1_9BURK|nr:hypothetical protein BN2475_750020 [Paraburkholderia ribeironis]
MRTRIEAGHVGLESNEMATCIPFMHEPGGNVIVALGMREGDYHACIVKTPANGGSETAHTASNESNAFSRHDVPLADRGRWRPVIAPIC